MKTTIMILALMSVALVGCGKKNSRNNGGAFQSFASTTTSGEFSIQDGQFFYTSGLRYIVSQQAGPQAGQTLQNIFNLLRTSPNSRLRATVVGRCGNTLNGFPNQGFPNQGFPNQGFPNQGFPNQGFPNQGQACGQDSQIIIESVTLF